MCDTLVAVGAATAQGVTLFAKNSDRPRAECQPFLQLPAMAHAPATPLRCTHVEIPQVDRTHAVLGHSPWWVWGFEHGVNEHGVAIGNELVFSNEEIEPTPGLIGMDLVRLGLERARSAREALEVMGGLLERHGQGGAAFGPSGSGYHNGFLLADGREAWVMQTSNRRWAGRRVRLDAISNHISLGSDWELGSPDLESFARAQGWWSESGRVDVAAAYRHRTVPARISEGRLRRSRALLSGAEAALDVPTLQRFLRDHGEHGDWADATPEEERYFTLCSHNDVQGPTAASLVAPLPRETSDPWPVWISFAAPCTSVFLPVYLHGVIPGELARGGEKPERDSVWWEFRALEEAAAGDLPRLVPRVREGWADLETRVEGERGSVERAARDAIRAGDADAAATLLTGFMTRIWRDARARASALRESIAS